MKNLIMILAVLLFFGYYLHAQDASSYFPSSSNYVWYFEVIPLDSLNNEIDSLAFYKVDSLSGTKDYKGKFANVIVSKVGYTGLPVFPSIDSTFISFDGSDAYSYMKFFNLDSLINNILPSSAATKRMSKEFSSKSSGDWYSYYRFAEVEKHQYQILSIDTTIDIDTLHIALRFEEKGTRLADETIHTKAGDFNCKKFLVQKIVNYLLFDILPVPLLTENDTIWIAQDRWIVKDVVPTTKLDLSTFGFGKQYFPGYKQVLIPEIPTGVNENKEMVSDFRLYQNYPNPFNPSTIIKYSLSANSDVSLTIYDIMGKEIVTLVNKKQNAGNYEVNFNPSKINNGLSSGVYFYQLQSADQVKTHKLLLLK